MVLDQASLLLVLVARFMVMIWECGLELSVLAAVRSRFSSALWTGGLTRVSFKASEGSYSVF